MEKHKKSQFQMLLEMHLCLFFVQKSHNSKDDSFHEGRQEDKIIRGELAYIHLIHDLAKQDEDLIEKDGKDALPFMVCRDLFLQP